MRLLHWSRGEEEEEEDEEDDDDDDDWTRTRRRRRRGRGQARCARVISDVLPLPPIPYHGVDLLFIRTLGCRAGR